MSIAAAPVGNFINFTDSVTGKITRVRSGEGRAEAKGDLVTVLNGTGGTALTRPFGDWTTPSGSAEAIAATLNLTPFFFLASGGGGPTLTNYVLVQSESDLPALVSGAHPCDQQTEYQWNGMVPIANNISLNSNTHFGIDPNFDGIEFAPGKGFVDSTVGGIAEVTLRNLTITGSGSTLFNLTDATNAHVFISNNCVYNGNFATCFELTDFEQVFITGGKIDDGGTFVNCTDCNQVAINGVGMDSATTKLGTISGGSVVSLTAVKADNSANGFTISTVAFGQIVLINNVFGPGMLGTQLELVGTTVAYDGLHNLFSVSAGVAGLDNSALTIFPGFGAGLIQTTVFGQLGGTVHVGTFNTQWKVDAEGIPREDDLVTNGSVSFTTPVATTMPAQNIWVKVAGTTTFGSAFHRTGDNGGTDNELEYEGRDPVDKGITGTYSFTTAGSNKVYEVVHALNGLPVGDVPFRQSFKIGSGSDIETVGSTALFNFANGDLANLYIRGTDATTSDATLILGTYEMK